MSKPSTMLSNKKALDELDDILMELSEVVTKTEKETGEFEQASELPSDGSSTPLELIDDVISILGNEKLDASTESQEGVDSPDSGQPQQDTSEGLDIDRTVSGDPDNTAPEGIPTISTTEPLTVKDENELDEIIEEIGIDILGGPPECAGCGEVIEATELVKALGEVYHVDCFKCESCTGSLGTNEFYALNGTPICAKCYKSMCPSCSRCGDPVMDRCLQAINKTWHVEHFNCTRCTSTFGNGAFYVFEDEPFCEGCFSIVSNIVCYGCKKVICGNYMIDANKRHWHPEHIELANEQSSWSSVKMPPSKRRQSFLSLSGRSSPSEDAAPRRKTTLDARLNAALAKAGITPVEEGDIERETELEYLDVMPPKRQRTQSSKRQQTHKRCQSEDLAFLADKESSPDALEQEAPSAEAEKPAVVQMQPQNLEQRGKWDSFLDDCIEGVDFKVFRKTDGQTDLAWANRKKLVSALAYEQVPDMSEIDVLLCTYHRHMTGLELLDRLTTRFRLEFPEYANEELQDYYKKWRVPMRMRLVNVMRRWIESRYEDFAKDSELLRAMYAFRDDVVAKDPRVGKRCVPLITNALILAQLSISEEEVGDAEKSVIEQYYESLDVLVSDMMHPLRGIPLFQRKHMFKSVRNCFYGEEALRWLTNALKQGGSQKVPAMQRVLSEGGSESSESTETTTEAVELEGSDGEGDDVDLSGSTNDVDDDARRRAPKSKRRKNNRSSPDVTLESSLTDSGDVERTASDKRRSKKERKARSKMDRSVGESPDATPHSSDTESAEPESPAAAAAPVVEDGKRKKDKKKSKKSKSIPLTADDDDSKMMKSRATHILGELIDKKVVNELSLTSKTSTFKMSAIYHFSDAMDARNRSVLDFSASDIASYITTVEHERFKQISIQDFEKKARGKESIGLSTFADRTTKLSLWVGTELCRASTNRQRTSIIQRFILLAEELNKLRNFESVLGVITGLKTVKMMKDAWRGIKGRVMDSYQSLCDSFSIKNNFSLYRQLQRDAEAPFIPYIGLILQDLTFIEDGNSDYDDGSRPIEQRLVNMKKMQLLSSIYMDVIRAQHASYVTSNPVPMLRFFVTERMLDTMSETQIRRTARKKLED